MYLSLGDAADRFTILTRKARIKPETVVREEFDSLLEYITSLTKEMPLEVYKSFLGDIVALSEINNGIWDMEFKVREGKEEELGLAVIGSRALKIRDLNGLRVKIKNRMNEYSKTGFKDTKVGHQSELCDKEDPVSEHIVKITSEGPCD